MNNKDFILIEAETFQDYGGWVLDQQFMDIMGSPFLLAHGIGTPVKDANTKIKIPASGEYRVWVRTRDWVAPWNKQGSPGRFEVKMNNTTLPVIFGTEGAEWHWQDGGKIVLPMGEISVVLHDLTGFEGRCDAILLSKDLNFTPPHRGKELEQFRNELVKTTIDLTPKDSGSYDLVVVGGGIAGICGAISAARYGLSVALIHDRPVVGGNNSSEVRVWFQGTTNLEPYPHIGDIVNELGQTTKPKFPEDKMVQYYDDKRKERLLNEAGVKLFLGYRMNMVETVDNQIQSVVAQNIRDGTRIIVRGRWFMDASGDACLGYSSGAEYEMASDMRMGQCNLWEITKTKKRTVFPKCPWAFDLTDRPFPGRQKLKWKYNFDNLRRLGCWFWESGCTRDPFTDDEVNRDTNFMAMYGAWDCLKNVEHAYKKHVISWASYISGRRESRRLMGDIIINYEQLAKQQNFEDGCVPTGWKIDLHVPREEYRAGFEGTEFITQANFTDYPRPFWIPYRALYSRNIKNLLMGGRNISATREGLGTIRVMRTGGMMGEVIGMALSLCKKYNCLPRDVYQHHLTEFKGMLQQGVPQSKNKNVN